MNFKWELGKEAKDKVTGKRGIIIGRIEYLTGCNQYGLVGKVTKDNKNPDCQWYDEGRIVIIGKGITQEEVKVEKNGGPNRDCPK